MKIIIENADQRDFNELANLARQGKIHTFYMTDEDDRPQGEWIPNYTSQFMNPGRSCSLCGKIVEFSENYCPQCGAYMRGDNNG